MSPIGWMGLLGLAITCLARCAGASERVDIPVREPRGISQLLAGGGKAGSIAGELTLPKDRAGPLPAMVIMHGSGGISAAREKAWAERLLALGLATLVVDSFGPRGITSTAEDQSQLPLAASIADGFAALAHLAAHPAIDARRIGIIGFSKGAQVAVYTALEPFRAGSIAGGQRFALHIALYSTCSLPYLAQPVANAAVHLLLGALDDYTPAAHCLRYADWLKAHGARVEAVVLDGAHHGFDHRPPVRFMARVQTASDCGLDIELPAIQGRRWDGGEIVPNERIGAYVRDCLTRGAHFGGNPEALAQAVALVGQATARHLLGHQ